MNTCKCQGYAAAYGNNAHYLFVRVRRALEGNIDVDLCFTHGVCSLKTSLHNNIKLNLSVIKTCQEFHTVA